MSHPIQRKTPTLLRTLIILVVAVGAVIPFSPAIKGEFLDWDDDKVVTENPHIRSLSKSNIKWMFTESKMETLSPPDLAVLRVGSQDWPGTLRSARRGDEEKVYEGA